MTKSWLYANFSPTISNTLLSMVTPSAFFFFIIFSCEAIFSKNHSALSFTMTLGSTSCVSRDKQYSICSCLIKASLKGDPSRNRDSSMFVKSVAAAKISVSQFMSVIEFNALIFCKTWGPCPLSKELVESISIVLR